MIPIDNSVLIVEDDLIIQLLYKRYAQMLGFNLIHTATTAREAITKANIHQPDLIIMDIILNGPKNGLMCAREIRSNLDTPIIFVSGISDPKTIKSVNNVPNSSFLSKPIDQKTIGRMILNLIPEITPPLILTPPKIICDTFPPIKAQALN